jgi:hypothetical protein
MSNKRQYRNEQPQIRPSKQQRASSLDEDGDDIHYTTIHNFGVVFDTVITMDKESTVKFEVHRHRLSQFDYFKTQLNSLPCENKHHIKLDKGFSWSSNDLQMAMDCIYGEFDEAFYVLKHCDRDGARFCFNAGDTVTFHGEKPKIQVIGNSGIPCLRTINGRNDVE